MNKWIETIEQSVYKLDEYYNKKIDNNKKLEFVVTLLLILGILIEIYLLNKPLQQYRRNPHQLLEFWNIQI